MKMLSKAAAILAIALMGTSAAQAQVWTDPTSPTGTALTVTIWDPVAGVSLVYAVPGETFQSARAGLQSFDNVAIPEFSTVFGGSNLGDIQYQVSAIGPDPLNSNRATALVTGPSTLPPVAVGNITGTNTNAQTFHAALNTACEFDGACAGTSADGQYGGLTTWGDLSAQLPFSAAAAVGNALFFYDLAQPDASRVGSTTPAIVTAIGGGTAQWLLSETGLLSYSVVPLPAAVWLLLTGLAGFGIVSRRRETPVAA